jgi:hypothetical protein
VAAGEDETQSIVLLRLVLLWPPVFGTLDNLPNEFAPAYVASEMIDGAMPCSRRDPAAWIWRQALDRPLPHGDDERILDSIFSEVDVTEDPDQAGYRSTGLLSEDPADQRTVDDGQRLGARRIRERPDLNRR